MTRILASATVILLAASCGGGTATTTATTTGITSASVSDSTTGSSSGSSSSGSAGGSSSTGEASTSAAPPDLPGFETLGPPKGCEKIDLLFVVADAGNLTDPKFKVGLTERAQRVRDATNDFIAVMQDQASNYDLQVMVVKGDPVWGTDECCGVDRPCDTLAPYPTCDGAEVPYEFTACDSMLGAGAIYPAGFMASNVPCELAGGHRYIAGAQEDFAGAFDCLINVGRTGGPQQYAGAMVQAVSPALNGPKGCNEGFLRSDAMLVVVLIADTIDQKSAGTPEGWAASLVAAKAGYTDGIVVVGILASYDPFQSDDCYDDPDDSVRRLVDGFPTHVLGSVCAPDLSQYLSQAVGVIETACEAFVPPG
jgi:hypothetical protein